jgi:DnaJ-class molecular chaperone
MSMRDPYATLGVARGASDGEIKRAYRRLAKRLHPDLNPGNRSVEQQFKEVTAAYDLLSDPGRRRRFDAGEIDADGHIRAHGVGTGARAGAWTHSDGFSLDDMLQEFLGRMRGGGAGKAAPAEDAATTASVTLSFLEAARGGKRRVELAGGRAVDVTIPAGIESGQKLRLRTGRSEVLLEVIIEPHRLFTRKGSDIHLEIPVTLAEAALGATITVPTIHGDVALKVPKGSNSGSLLRLRGKGIAGGGGQGDQYVKLQVMLPDPPDPELSAFLERWAKAHAYEVRGKPGAA